MKFLRYFYFFVVISFFACESESNLRDFYFSKEGINEGSVYEYQDTALASSTYWYIQEVTNDSGTYQVTTIYDSHTFEQRQISTEEVLKGGMRLTQLRLLGRDSLGNVNISDVDIKAGNVFPFEVNPNKPTVLVTDLAFTNPSDSNIQERFTRNRQYLKDTLWQVLGEEREIKVFLTKETLENRNAIEGDFTTTRSGEEWYAKGIGLVRRINKIGTYRTDDILTGIYSMDSLTSLYNRQMERGQSISTE